MYSWSTKISQIINKTILLMNRNVLEVLNINLQVVDITDVHFYLRWYVK